jgi:hypothetical protein
MTGNIIMNNNQITTCQRLTFNNSIAIGDLAGNSTQLANAVAVGNQAGQTGQKLRTTAVGNLAGNLNQGEQAVAIGFAAGQSNQSGSCVAIGPAAGQQSQGLYSVAVGLGAGQISQNSSSVAIGSAAGYTGQGSNCIAIGTYAGETNQFGGSIILNATGATFNNQLTTGLFIKPIRNVENDNLISYNTGLGELTYSTKTTFTRCPAEQLKIIRGNVNSNRTIAQGSGFTISPLVSTGVYVINFTTAFTTLPSISFTLGGSDTTGNANSFTSFKIAPLTSFTVSSCQVIVGNNALNSGVDVYFQFIAIGT